MAVPTYVGVNGGFDSTSDTDVVVTYPTASADGDLVIIGLETARTTAGTYTISTPSGWNLITDASSNPSGASDTRNFAFFWKFRGAETTVTITISVAVVKTWVSIAYNGDVDTSDPIGVAGFTYDNATADNSLACPDITTDSNDNAVFRVALANRVSSTSAYTHTWPAGHTERHDTGGGWTQGVAYMGRSIATKDSAQASPGAVGSVTATTSVNTDFQYGVTITVQPFQNLTKTEDDTGSGAETETVTADVPSSDTNTAVDETVSFTIAPAQSDTNTAVDETVGTFIITPAEADTGTAAETTSITATAPPDTDTGTAAETEMVSVAQVSSDTNTAVVESESLTVGVEDTGTASESAFVSVALMIDSDTGTADETTNILVSDGDTNAGFDEVAFRASDGILNVPRLIRITEERRTLTVERVDRTVVVTYDNRLKVIGREDRTVKVLPVSNLVSIGAEK